MHTPIHQLVTVTTCHSIRRSYGVTPGGDSMLAVALAQLIPNTIAAGYDDLEPKNIVFVFDSVEMTSPPLLIITIEFLEEQKNTVPQQVSKEVCEAVINFLRQDSRSLIGQIVIVKPIADGRFQKSAVGTLRSDT